LSNEKEREEGEREQFTVEEDEKEKRTSPIRETPKFSQIPYLPLTERDH
jgi:hypothetical protein